MATDLTERLTELLADPALRQDPLRPFCEELLEERRKLWRRLDRISRISDGYQLQLRELNRELSEANQRLSTALSEVRTLQGFIPICTRCKRVRNDEGFWDDVESYLGKRSGAALSRGVCPACSRGEPLEPPAPSSRTPARDADEEGQRLRDLLSSGAFEGNPLLAEHVRLSRRFAKLARRLEKISRISDGFQSQLKELNASLQRASLTDPLTGLANRRAALERLRAEANRSLRSGRPFVVVMVDVDGFKKINDTLGHDAGDTALRELARLFQSNLRSFDVCARWGGDEFLLLLTETLPDLATAAAEKLRALVEAQRLSNAAGMTFTISAGVATHEPNEPVEDAIRDADRALYAAKLAGRNRVVSAESL